MSLGMSFEVSEVHVRLISLFFSACNLWLRHELFAIAPGPRLPACCHAAHRDNHRLALYNCEQARD